MNTTKCLQKNLIDGAHHASKQSSYNKTLKDLFHKEERDHQVAMYTHGRPRARY